MGRHLHLNTENSQANYLMDSTNIIRDVQYVSKAAANRTSVKNECVPAGVEVITSCES